ncbi:MAG: hypothetical protein ACD_4C00101G0001 [uncultured bacterium (gcode 4)]|uniref:Uncharacterized protein n=1 Tax=uncultured bacterium (gcode 4) TaxID=1234023 RepID=K2G9W9_9BACT|nr:MAG: hypothetical protein ACD_4C00101G0001 [uncultured bacterium (gcode 4)]
MTTIPHEMFESANNSFFEENENILYETNILKQQWVSSQIWIYEKHDRNKDIIHANNTIEQMKYV